MNVAGFNRKTQALEMTEESWDDVLTVNLRSVFFLCQGVARRWIEGKRFCAEAGLQREDREYRQPCRSHRLSRAGPICGLQSGPGCHVSGALIRVVSAWHQRERSSAGLYRY